MHIQHQVNFQDKVKGFNDKFILMFVNDINGNFERICVEISSEKPRKGRLKAFAEALKQSANLVPKVVEIGANIATIISFVQPSINQ